MDGCMGGWIHEHNESYIHTDRETGSFFPFPPFFFFSMQCVNFEGIIRCKGVITVNLVRK